MPKDNFSAQSKAYASFRPVFPKELYDSIINHVNEFDLAWDVATGNGQSAIRLSPYFNKVIATDISENQLAQAAQSPNIIYRNEPAEHSSLADRSVNLITISQAIHWFEFDAFYKEVIRVTKQGSIIAAFSYSMLNTKEAGLDDLIQHFYKDSEPFWDRERKYIDEHYSTIPFPFDEIAAPVFNIKYKWNFEQLTGYIETWSANQHYMRMFERSLVSDDFKKSLQERWPKQEFVEIQFPVHLRMGMIT